MLLRFNCCFDRTLYFPEFVFLLLPQTTSTLKPSTKRDLLQLLEVHVAVVHGVGRVAGGAVG